MTEIKTTTVIEVPFYDVDAMEVAWHGNYVKYMEQARCQLLDLIDYNYPQMKASGYVWPVVELKIKFIKPLLFQQKIAIDAVLSEHEYGLRVDFVFWDVATQTRLTKAHTKQVAVNIESNDMCLVSPDILHNKIKAYLGAI